MMSNDPIGVIFDVDGVLVDSNPVHLETWQIIGREDGFDFTPELFLRRSARRPRRFCAAAGTAL